MVKRLILASFILMIILNLLGCNYDVSTDDPVNQSLQQNINSVNNETDQFIYDIIEDNSQVILLDDLYDLNESEKIADYGEGVSVYLGKYRSIFIAKNEIISILSGELSSYPEFSPNKSKMAYIDSFDFETIGNVYIYDFATEENSKITDFEYGQSDTSKAVEWLNNENLLLIIGFAYGTITQGGDLYLYDLEEGTLNLLLESEGLMEIKDVKIIDDKIILSKVIWKDNNYMEYDVIEEEVNISI